MGDLDNKTKVPLFAVLGAIPVLIGGIAFCTTVYFKVEAATRNDEKQMDLLLEIRDRVIRLEAASGIDSQPKQKGDKYVRN